MSVNDEGNRMCDVSGCSKEAERSVNGKKLKGTTLAVGDRERGSIHLCKDHYRTFKKETKKERKLENLGY